jgi:hypothetical protein
MEYSFDEYGNFSGTIPQECIKECTQPGQDASIPVSFWVRKLGFSVPRQLAEKYLEEFGAWDDLQTASDTKLAERVLWIACGDIDEDGGWFGLIH